LELQVAYTMALWEEELNLKTVIKLSQMLHLLRVSVECLLMIIKVKIVGGPARREPLIILQVQSMEVRWSIRH